MVIKSVNLETVVGVTTKKLPNNVHPEIAFAGKSNVGKSSLINALINRKSYAKTSSTPGKTQTMNFYNVNDAVYFVDLPGYGYAAVRQDFKAQWGPMIEKYLRGSGKLKAIFLLVDIRHEPSQNDCIMYDWIINAGFKPILVATKADKLKKSQIPAALLTISNKLRVTEDTMIIPFSALKKDGRDEIMRKIDDILKQ